MAWLDFFKRQRKGSAAVAKERLQMVLVHERQGQNPREFLPKMQEEILAVIAKYIQIDPGKLQVQLEEEDGMEVLEVNVVLSDGD